MINYYDYDLHLCNITAVLVPNRVPMNNTYLWEPCNCGRKCSSLSPCIKLYTSVSRGKMIKENYYYDRHSECTFQDEKCENDLVSIMNSLNESHKYIDKYLNKTVDCYYDNKMTDIYLKKDVDMISGYIYAGFTLTLMLCLWYIVFKTCKNTKPKPTKEDRFEKIESYSL